MPRGAATEEGVPWENWPVVMRPGVLPAPVESRLTPNEFSMLRSISANFTRSMICLSAPGGTTCKLFTTVLASEATRAAARSATAWLLACPISASASRSIRTSMASSGKVSFSRRRTGSRSLSTVTAYMLRAPVFDQITSVDRPEDLAFIRISRVVTATASTTSGLLMDTRATSDARSKTTLRPTLSFIGSGVSGISPPLAATAAPASAKTSTERTTAVVTDPVRSFRVIKY